MRRALARVALAAALALLALLAALHLLLRASLPVLDGRIVVAGAAAPVLLERDGLGVVTVRAASRPDLAFGTGFAHAQDRFFEMDLSRRLAAGELAELVGPAALDQDRRARIFRFRAVARAVLAGLSPSDRTVLVAYAAGVNAGLRHLGSRPWEYWVLRSEPAAWRAEDSLLVGYAMWWDLQYGDLEHDRIRRALDERLGGARCGAWKCALEFLYPARTAWDSPTALTAGAVAPAEVQIPTAAELDVRAATPARLAAHARPAPRSGPPADWEPWADWRQPADVGSNSWALAGRLTADGAGLVASDMHLSLRVPPVWYRMRLIVPSQLDATGVTLPGTPLLVAGSNGAIAWAFTNSAGHWLQTTPAPCAEPVESVPGVRTETEVLRVKGGADVPLAVHTSPLGVRVRQEPGGRCWFARWLAERPEASNLGLLHLERARSAQEALALAPELGIPHQNLIVADSSGHIGWAIAGRIPRAREAARFADQSGWLTGEEAPHRYDPPLGRLWTANARSTDDPSELAAIGGEDESVGSEYALGARAGQIRDALAALSAPATPRDMLPIQLDDRALFLARWRTLLLAVLDAAPGTNAAPAPSGSAAARRRAEVRALVARWDARAAVSSVGYRIVRAYREHTAQAVWQMILDACGVDSDAPPPPQFEQPLWTLVTRQPLHMLAPQYASWGQFLLLELDRTAAELESRCGTLASCRWGLAHPVHIGHPIGRALPWFSRLTDMHALELPGDHDMPRVQEGAFGASERFAVSPGHESAGYLQLPGGQSGHPLSPYYRAGFDAWAQGTPLPFLPGPPQHRLQLTPP